MKVLKWLDENFEEKTTIALLIITVLLTFFQVVMRYIFKNSLAWSEELARYLFLYLIWIGASYAAKVDGHLRVEILKDKIPEDKKLIFEDIIYLIWLGFSIFLFISSIKLTSSIFANGQLSPAMRIPMGFPYLSIPIGSGLMSFRLVQKMINRRRKSV